MKDESPKVFTSTARRPRRGLFAVLALVVVLCLVAAALLGFDLVAL